MQNRMSVRYILNQKTGLNISRVCEESCYKKGGLVKEARMEV